MTEVKHPIYTLDPATSVTLNGRYRAAAAPRRESDELRLRRHHNTKTHRCSLIFVCILGAVTLLFALTLEIAGLALPYWMILPNIPGNNPDMNFNLQGVSNQAINTQLYRAYTSTYYSGMWMFCGYTADADVFIDHDFCMPAEIWNPSAPTMVIKFNGFVGYWRLTTRGLALAAASVTLFTIAFSLISVCACCTKNIFGKISVILWIIGSLLALILTLATVIYFIVSFQLDATKMFYNAGGTTIYERRPYISFYLFVAAIGVHILGLLFGGAAAALALLSGNHHNLESSV